MKIPVLICSLRNKNLAILLVLLSFSFTSYAQLPQYAWANTLRGLTSDYSLTNSSSTHDITHDAAGNIYTVGNFYGSIDANSGSGTTTLAAAESGIRAFIIKTSSSGSLIWAKALQGLGTADARSVRVDANGNVYFTGRFTQTVDFDPGSGTFNMTSVSNSDMYMAKLDALGGFVWAKKLSPASFIHPTKMELDPNGNPIYVGYFSGATDFNPNTGTTSITGSSNSFILKLDPSGNFVFVKHFASTSTNSVEDIEVTAAGDIFLTGYYTSSTDFDPDAGTAPLSTISFSQDAFICKLNSNGNYQWAKGFGGPNSDQINAMDLDNAGNILVTGSFRNYVDFDPGASSFVLQTAGSTLDDIFVAKYSSSGNFVWVKQIGSSDGNYTDENSNDIAVDPSGNICVTGFFYQDVDFDPGSGNFTLSTSLNRNTFVVSLNSIGAFNYAFKFNMVSLGSSESEAIDIDDNGNMYVGGYTEGLCDMNPGSAVNTIDSEFNQGFLLKLSSPTSEASFALPSYNGCVGNAIGLVSTNSALQSTWQWTASGGTIADPTAANTSITFTQSGFYSIILSVTSDLGTTATTLTVNIYVSPTISVTASPSMLCINGSTTLSAISSSGTIAWSSGQSSTIITVSPPVTTTYTATVTASNGCSASASQTIDVVTVPNVLITASDNAICTGESVTLTASGALSYTWNNGSTGSSITVSPGSTVTYSVTGNVGACVGSDSQAIQVSTSPAIAVQSTSNTVCSGAGVTLTATGGISYVWSTGQTTASITVTPGVTTTYSVVGTSSSGCQNTASKTITVGSNPTINVSSSNNTPCAGASIVLTATGGVNYVWTTGQTTNAITVSPLVNTTYTVTGTNAAGCQTTANKIINVDPLPTIIIQSATNAVCAGTDITLSATGGDSYSWNSGQTSASITVTPVSTTTYTVTGANSFNCQATASKTITVNPLPTVTIQSSGNSICAGNSLVLSGMGALSYSWNTGENIPSITISPATTTTYTVTGTNSFNCQSIASKIITVNALPEVAIQIPEDTICEGSSLVLNASGASGYSWSTGENSTTITVTPPTTTSYTVIGTTAAGCQNTASGTIAVIAFPAVSFNDPATIFCSNSAFYTYTATPEGGVFQGPGITGNTFDPAIAGIGTHTISYTYSDVLCSATTSIEVTVDECLTTEWLNEKTHLRVYPNPAKEKLVIDGLSETAFIQLVSMQGQTLLNEKSSGSQHIICLNSFSAGVYTLQIQTDRQAEFRKIVISQ